MSCQCSRGDANPQFFSVLFGVILPHVLVKSVSYLKTVPYSLIPQQSIEGMYSVFRTNRAAKCQKARFCLRRGYGNTGRTLAEQSRNQKQNMCRLGFIIALYSALEHYSIVVVECIPPAVIHLQPVMDIDIEYGRLPYELLLLFAGYQLPQYLRPSPSTSTSPTSFSNCTTQGIISP